MIEGVFFGSVILIAFTYIGYPLTLLVLRSFRDRPVNKGDFEPDITVLLAAHNEESHLETKLENLLATDYPASKREIIVVSDGSTDRTNEIAAGFGHNVRLLVLEHQKGKEAALAWGLQEARAEIVVMTDVDTRLDVRGIREIVANFCDESVGCVTGEDRVRSRDGSVSGEGLYIAYGTWIRRLESSVNSVIGLSGSFCAARKSLCIGLTDHAIDCDLKIALTAMRRGLRAVNDKEALGLYAAETSCSDEFKRKLRTTMRGLTAVAAHRDLLNPIRYGITSYQIIGRKILPWCVPCMALVAFLSSGALAVGDAAWQVVWGLQALFYAAGIFAYRYPRIVRGAILFPLAAYFVLCQWALIVGWYRVLKGERVWAWRPTNQ